MGDDSALGRLHSFSTAVTGLDLLQDFTDGSSGDEKLKDLAKVIGWWSIVGDVSGAQDQEAAANEASRLAQEAGQSGARKIASAGDAALADARGGTAGAMSRYGQAMNEAQQYQQGLGGLYAGERAGGQASLQQLNQMMSGDMSQLALDPSYQFQKQEAERALAHAAAAGGSYGSGTHFKNLARVNQNLAATAYGQAASRLMGSAQQGLAAETAYQGLNQGAAANIMGLYGDQANLLGNSGAFLAQLQQNTASAQANSLNQVANQVASYGLQGANMMANAYRSAGAQGQAIGNSVAAYAGNQAPSATDTSQELRV